MEGILVLAGLIGVYAALVAGLVVIATEFHERSHWVIGRIWSRPVSIQRWKGIIACSVYFHKPYELPLSGIRLAGIAPVLFGIPLGFLAFTLIDAPFSSRLIYALPFWGGMVISPADVLAILFPERFQRFADDEEELGHIGMLKLVLKQIRRSMKV